MRGFSKGIEPGDFTRWKSLANNDWTPEYSNLQNPEKQNLLKALLREQLYCCCYCGREIDESESHIEHFRPQSEYPHLELDYQNLHASCIRASDPDKPLHCGHTKESWFDENAYVSPLEPDCESKFRYLLHGKVEPGEPSDIAAENMISKLALNARYLVNRRNEVILGIFDKEFIEAATEVELRQIISSFETPENGRLTPFSHIVSRFAQQLLDE